MKIIPINSVIQRSERIKGDIEAIIAKKEVEIKQLKEESLTVVEKIKTKSQELMNDLQLAKDFEVRSEELVGMVEPRMNNWGLSKNITTILKAFITVNSSLSHNYVFACKKALEIHNEGVAKATLDKIEMKRMNIDLLTKNLNILELQYNIINTLLVEYDNEFDKKEKELIHEKLSKFCASIENNNFYDYLLKEFTR